MPGSADLLERQVYGIGEAARLLGVRADRARAWLDGYERCGVVYPPVIRSEHTGQELVSWGEFVELGYLREYRRAGVSLQRLRPVVAALLDELGTPYPLATARPFVSGKELVLELQDRYEVPPAIAIVVRTGQTIGLTEPAERFMRKVEFDATGSAHRLLPAGSTSPVAIDPRVNFGTPSVANVSTERLWELFDAGERVEEIATGYELDPAIVAAAVAYEEQLLALAA